MVNIVINWNVSGSQIWTSNSTMKIDESPIDKLVRIVIYHSDYIYRWNWYDITMQDWIISMFWDSDWRPKRMNMSINDLISPDTWFIQAVKRKPNWSNCIKINPKLAKAQSINHIIFSDKSYQEWHRQYHSMIMSLLGDNEKISYLFDNIIIDEYY